MLLQFANGRSSLPAPTLAITSGGTTTASRTLYFALQGQNIAGYNLLSPIVGPVTIGIGQQVTITLPSTVHNPGEYFSDYVISTSLTNTAADFVQVARVAAQGSGGANISLPTSIALSTDEHFNLSAIVASPSTLPTTNLIRGMRRGVASLNYVFEYDALNTQTSNATSVLTSAPAPGNWVRVGGFSTIVANTTDPGGCAQDISTISEGAIVPPPYALNGSNGVKERFWLVNDSSEVIPSGLRVMIGVTLDGAPASGLLEGLLRIIFRGYVNISDGSIRTTTTAGISMLGVDQEILFENKKTDLILQDDLQPGEAYSIDIYPNLRPEFLNNQVSNHALIQISVGLALQAGSFVEGGSAQGDRIYPEFDRGIVIPRKVGAKCLKRSGLVNSRSFLGVSPSLVVGLQPNAYQFLYINSNGSVYLKAEAKLDTEAIRAKISTVAGVGNASPWSSPLTIGAGSGINIICTYPSNGTSGTIRASYPDPLLSGNSQGEFNCQLLTLYLRSTVASVATIKKFEGRLIVDGATQTFQVSGWSSGVTISTVPAAPSLDFCLFDAVSATVTAAGVGDLPAGTIEVAFAYQFDGTQISAISHSSIDGCLFTSTLTQAQIEQASQYWGPAVGAIADLRAVPTAQIIAYQSRYVAGVNNPYRYLPSSTDTDDGNMIVKPGAIAIGQAGRWVADVSNAIYTLTVAPTSTTPGGIGDIAIVANVASADNGKLYQKTSFTTWTFQATIIGPVGATGIQGVAGATGSQGNVGVTGAQGLPGETGSQGNVGVTGAQGLPGETGSPGTVTAAGGLIIEATASLATTATQLALRNSGGILTLRDPSSGAESTIATLDKSQAYTKAQRSTPVALTDAASIAIDVSLSNMYTVTLAGARALANPTNLQAGSNFEIRITPAGQTLTYGTAYKFPGGTVPTLSTAAGAIDILSCRSYAGLIVQCDLGKGYA